MFSRKTDIGLLLKRGWMRGLKNVVRGQGWAGSLGSLFGVLLLGQVFLLLLFAVHVGLQFLQAQTDVRLEVLDSASNAHIQDLVQNVRSLPYVDDVAYVTREQAYDRQRQSDPQLVAFLEKFGIANPFPETVSVRLHALADEPALLQFLQQPVFAQTIDPKFLSQTTDQQQQMDQLVQVVASARFFLLLVICLVGVVLFFVILELLRRRTLERHKEVFIEQLVGAPAFMTALPFAIEMMLLLFGALLLSLLFAVACVVIAPHLIPALGVGGAGAGWSQQVLATLLAWLPWILLVQFLLAPVFAVIGTGFVLWKKIAT